MVGAVVRTAVSCGASLFAVLAVQAAGTDVAAGLYATAERLER